MIYEHWSIIQKGHTSMPRLNPYSNGIWSTRYYEDTVDDIVEVLILILMEYDLRGIEIVCYAFEVV